MHYQSEGMFSEATIVEIYVILHYCGFLGGLCWSSVLSTARDDAFTVFAQLAYGAARARCNLLRNSVPVSRQALAG